MATNYPIVFSEMKSRVSINSVAHTLGYAIDRKAGVGRYIEMVLGDPRNPSDRIIVKNSPDTRSQFFFRRDGSKGDVIELIRENLNSFNVPGANEWTKIANVLAQFANMPLSETLGQHRVISAPSAPKTFNPDRYEVYRANPNDMPWILQKRGFDPYTVTAMGDSLLLIRDRENTRFNGFNIGFPYVSPESGKLTGYEIRGSNGFKAKATGTDSANSAWMVDFPPGSPQLARNVYFFESAFDAMAFYQLNRQRLQGIPFAMVSVGGAFSPALAEKIMGRYPGARAWDCFDNDTAGNIYAANLVKVVDKVDFKITHSDNDIIIDYGEKSFRCPKERLDFKLASNELGLKHSVGHWKAPANFKDWNDCLLGKQIEIQITPSKYERDANLYERRQASQKL